MSNKFIFRFVVTMEKNKSLRNLNTFGIDVTAKYFVSILSVEELKELSNTHNEWIKKRDDYKKELAILSDKKSGLEEDLGMLRRKRDELNSSIELQ